MKEEAQEDRTVDVPIAALQEMAQMGAISGAQLERIRDAASSPGAGDTGRLQIAASSLDRMVSSGVLTVAQRELILQRSQTLRPFTILGIPLNLTSILIIIGLGLIIISFGGLVAAIFAVADTRLGHVLLVSLLMATFIITGLLVRHKLSLLAGELLIMGGVILTPWLVGAATTGKGLPVGVVTATMIVLGVIGWNIRRPASQLYISLSRARVHVPVGPGLIFLIIISIFVPFIGIPIVALIIFLAMVTGGYFSPSRLGDTIILIAVAMTPAFLFTGGYALRVPEGNWNGSALLFPSLVVFALAYRIERFFLYGLPISLALVATPIVLFLSFDYEPSFRMGSGIVGLTALAIVMIGLATDARSGNKGDSPNLLLWFHAVGLASFSGGLFGFLDSFDNEAIFVGYSGASILILFGALRLKRVTWTVIGLGSLGVYVVRLLVETLGPDASYALTAIGIVLVVAALYMRRRAQGRRITNA
ncbi:MAG: hypothetical protein IIC81_04075 [Chloroflexi bacterium]|nr:hypothetical protein [Chloroflexota bacterium]